MRTSYSALETFKQCPLKYKYGEIDRIKAPKSKEAVFGSIIHETLKFLHGTEAPPPIIDQILNFYKDRWNSDVYQDQSEEAAMFSQGVKIIRDYYQKNHPSKFHIIGLETRFEIPINEHILAGKIDRIDKLEDGIFEIIDYKTTRKMPSQETIDSDLQLSIYRLGLNRLWPNLDSPKVKLSLYYLKHGIKLSTYKTNEQLERTKQHIINIIKEIQKNDFKPIPSILCDWCGYKKICPMWRHKYQEPQIPNLKSQNETEKIIREYFELIQQNRINNKRLAELKGIINTYCDNEKVERIFGNEGYITRLSQQRFGYDFDSLCRILQPLGKWDKVLAINNAKLRKVLGEIPEDIRQEINNARKIEKEFKVLKIKIEKKQKENRQNESII